MAPTIADTGLPPFIPPQLSRLVTAAPAGDEWAHELKYDGYRMHARHDRGRVQLLTRAGRDWTMKYPAIAGAFAPLRAETAYFDGELCGVLPDGRTAFNLIQNASDGGNADALVFFLFDLLWLDGCSLVDRPLIERKAALQRLLPGGPDRLHYAVPAPGVGVTSADRLMPLLKMIC